MQSLVFMSDAALTASLTGWLRNQFLQLLPTGVAQFDLNVPKTGGAVRTDHIAAAPPGPWFAFFAEIQLSLSTSEKEARSLAARLSELPRERVGRSICFVADNRQSPKEALGSGGTLDENPAFVKQVCLIRRRPDISRSEFIDYYEGNHAPLAARLLPQFMTYYRLFPVPDAIFSNEAPLVEEVGTISAITQMCFRSAEAHREFQAEFAKPEVGHLFAEDEEKLFDRSSISMFIVDQMPA